MEDAVVMTIFGLKSAGYAVIRNSVNTACSIPRRILKIVFGIQIKMIYLALDCLVRIYRVVQYKIILKYIFPEKISSPEPVVDQKDVVKGARKVRRALCVTFEQLYGLDVKSDMNLIQDRLDEFHKCMEGDDYPKIFHALAKVKELNKPLEDGSWKEKYIQDFRVIEYADNDSEAENAKPVNMLEEPKCDKTLISNDLEVMTAEEMILEEISPEKQLEVEEPKPVRKTSQENGGLKSRLSITIAKLEEVLKMSSHLVGELSRLNSQVSRLTVVSEKMTAMQNELGEGRRLLFEIEADRNEMKKKLSTLERMIQEEEQYLDDMSCESGYDEGETLVSEY